MIAKAVVTCLFIVTIIQMVQSTCCKGKHDEGCYGNGLCDTNCCNCEGGCNKYLVLSSCGWIKKAECAFDIAKCAATCLDDGIGSSQCKSCFGGAYTKCFPCIPADMGIEPIVNDTQRLTEVRLGCSAINWLECAAIVVGCAAACIEPVDPLCVDCMGSLYHKCIGCVTLSKMEVQLLTNNTHLIVKNYHDDFQTTCQKSTTHLPSKDCCKGMHDGGCYGNGLCDANCCNCDGGCNRYLMMSKCPWILRKKCMARVAWCAGVCITTGLGSQECIKCFGKLYGECVTCLVESLEAKQVVADNTEMMKLRLGCSVLKWAECAARLALCATSCIDHLDPSCISCMGNLYNTCKSCFSANMDLQRLQFNTQALVSKRYTDFNGVCQRKPLVPGNCCKSQHEDACYGNGLCDENCCNCEGGCNEYMVLSSCKWTKKLKCALKVAKCAATCLAHGVLSSQCKTCFGSLYSECIKCLPTEMEAVDIIRDNEKMIEMRLGCNILECGIKIALCATKCIPPTKASCISCLGSAYEECKDCFFADTDVIALKNNTDVLVEQFYGKQQLNTSCSLQSSSAYSVVPSQVMMGFFLIAFSLYFLM
ncbi:uncharacterized protein [Clytia hemisphaerica]|uniref:uncharacterized protein n=1 Tax=Clytia hemisphaerica TaxID=252671 RepID=UPI0034D62421